MKRVLLVLILNVCIYNVFGQVSKDNYIGNWSDNNSWVDDAAPANATDKATSIDIYGYVQRNGDLDFKNNARITVYDTLLVNGNLTLKNNAIIDVKSNAVLIILGNYAANNNMIIDNGGRIVMAGEIEIDKNAEVTNSGAIYAYDPNPMVGSKAKYNGIGILGNENTLGANDPSLYSFVNGGFTTLPVELLDFTASVQRATASLNWATVSEENFDYFSVERSQDGKYFEEIGTVKGGGNTTSIRDYSYVDNNPLPGRSFYRLKSVDFDGYTEYFKIVSVSFDNVTENIADQVKFYPNPNKGQNLTILTNLRADSSNKVRVLNSAGREVLATNLQFGTNAINFKEQLPKGMYYVIIGSGQSLYKSKLIVE